MKIQLFYNCASISQFIAATFLSLSAAQADQISVNYDIPLGSTTGIGPAEVAGFVPAVNWNNVGVIAPAANSLVDNSGTVTTLGAVLSIVREGNAAPHEISRRLRRQP